MEPPRGVAQGHLADLDRDSVQSDIENETARAETIEASLMLVLASIKRPADHKHNSQRAAK